MKLLYSYIEVKDGNEVIKRLDITGKPPSLARSIESYIKTSLKERFTVSQVVTTDQLPTL